MNFFTLFRHGVPADRDADPVALFMAIPRYFRLFVRLLADRRVRLWPKLVFGFALIYFLSPLDAIPDFLLPIVGWFDDVAVFLFAARYLLRSCPEEVLREHVERIQGGAPESKHDDDG